MSAFYALMVDWQLKVRMAWPGPFYTRTSCLIMVLLSGLSCRVCHVLKLLQRVEIRGSTRLHVPSPAVQNSLQNTKPPIRLHIWLDFAEAECKSGFCSVHECSSNGGTRNSTTTDKQCQTQAKSRALVSWVALFDRSLSLLFENWKVKIALNKQHHRKALFGSLNHLNGQKKRFYPKTQTLELAHTA